VLSLWTRGAAAVTVLCCVALRGAAQEFEFTGPPPTRNFQPIQLIFLNLPFERAATIEPGGVALLIETAESSVIATHDGSIRATLKFETNRTVFGIRYGLQEGWEVGLELPFISRYGGCLDPLIIGVEELFDAKNPERDLFPENSYGGFIVARGDTVLFDGDEETFQPGDLVLSVKRQLPLPPRWPRLALRGAIKLPSGDADAVLGSGNPDFGAGLAADYHALGRLMIYLNANLIYPVGPITAGDLTLNPIVTESFAAQFALTRHLSMLFHQATYTSPFHGTGAKLLDGTVVELGAGLGFAYAPYLFAEVLGINNVSGVEQSSDFTLLLSLEIRPWGRPTDLPPLADGPPMPLPPLGPPPASAP
jgi:hypothetical protein